MSNKNSQIILEDNRNDFSFKKISPILIFHLIGFHLFFLSFL